MRKRPSAFLAPLICLSVLVLGGPSSGCATVSENQAAEASAPAEDTGAEQAPIKEASTDKASVEEATIEEAGNDETKVAEKWGIEITSLRLTSNDHMLDYRYRVLDADKATDLFKRQIKPYLIHQETGQVMAVPETAKLGPLRNSNIPQEGKIYWMFFGNAGNLIQAGDKVTVVIGEFRVEDLVVE
jgi:hypothetical protein